MTDSREPITGLVARVISNTKLVINRGQAHGVKPGQTFAVMSRQGEAIADPENDEIIGVLPVEKTRVKVSEVYEKMAVAETYRQRTIGGTSPLSDVFGPPREVIETFPLDNKSEVVSSDDTVRVKDPVRQVFATKREPF